MYNFFLGIGAPRAGTTWLANYFLQHPQVCFSPIKELHYFDAKYLPEHGSFFDAKFKNDFEELAKKQKVQFTQLRAKRLSLLKMRLEMIEDESQYLNYFAKIYQGEKIVGEITPAYCMLKEQGFLAIKNLIPRVKILFIIRNPVDRYWSHVRYHKKRFKKDINLDDYFSTNINVDEFYERGNYKRTIETIQSVFSKESILIVHYEYLFQKEGAQYLQKITNFLDIPFFKPNISNKINASPYIPLSMEQRRFGVRALKEQYQYVIEHHIGEVPKNWYNDLELL